MTSPTPLYLIIGRLQREFLITADKKTYIDQSGGNCLYAAGGAALWLDEDEPLGLVARVGEDYPREWLADFETHGYLTGGISIVPEDIDVRSFRIYSDLETYHTTDPIGHFAKLEVSFPRSLLGYKDNQKKEQGEADLTEVSPISIRKAEIPTEFVHANAAHICPVDYITHSLMPALLQAEGVATITLDPAAEYMQSIYWNEIPPLLTRVTAFLPSEEKMRQLFKRRTEDLWEMVDQVAEWGVDLIVVKRGERGQLLYDALAKKRYEIPAYAARAVDTTGAGDAFCGGFLAGYRHTFDPVRAALHGNVAASIEVEGAGAFYAQNVLPGLPQARLDSLAELVREV